MSWLILILVGCETNPVLECDLWPWGTCCTDDDQCAAAYPEWPFCAEPDRSIGGICSMCITDADCPPTEHHASYTCEVDEHGFGVCFPDARCGTPDAEPVCSGIDD